jgi:hypothetical protein
MSEARTLLFEDNIISLRTAIVLDDGNLVSFQLMLNRLDISMPRGFNYGKSDHTWLYRWKRSYFNEAKLKRGSFSIEQDIRPMVFERPPGLKLIWAESGQGVALFLNGEPWAFIHEEKKHGYSKGILRPTIGNPWDQELFEKTFMTK